MMKCGAVDNECGALHSPQAVLTFLRHTPCGAFHIGVRERKDVRLLGCDFGVGTFLIITQIR